MQRKLLLPALLLVVSGSQAVAATDYSAGVFIVNEDWYGHQNSTINYFDHNDADGNVWQYRVLQSENPGKELGCTNQFGTIYGGLFFNVAKQERDPGAGVTGGRISILDAATMKFIYQSEIIDPSGTQCDGRGCLGVDENTFYISTSNGVWVFDVPTRTVTGMVEGTANPNGTDGKPNSDPTGSLYHGQCGSMVRCNEFVYVAHQSAGLLVINPESARVVETITMSEVNERAFADGYFVEEVRDLSKGAGIGSVVLGADGNIWYSVAKDIQGLGATLPYIVRVDPDTHSQTIIRIPDGVYPPANSWYAWTPDGFCAAAKKNVLYWNGGPNSWFSSERIYRYDIDSDEVSLIIDFNEEAKAEGLDDTTKWKLYGCSMRPHPVTGELYLSLFHQFQDPTYKLRRTDAEGVKLGEYPMISHYWFPSIPVFPDNHAPEVHQLPVADVSAAVPTVIELKGLATDADNMDAAIVYSVASVSNPELFSAVMTNGNLEIRPVSTLPAGEYWADVKVNSNGRLANARVEFDCKSSGIGDVETGDTGVMVRVDGNSILVDGADSFEVYNAAGCRVAPQGLLPGIYVVRTPDAVVRVKI